MPPFFVRVWIPGDGDGPGRRGRAFGVLYGPFPGRRRAEECAARLQRVAAEAGGAVQAEVLSRAALVRRVGRKGYRQLIERVTPPPEPDGAA